MIPYLYKKFYMTKSTAALIIAFLSISPFTSRAASEDTSALKIHPPIQKFYIGGSTDAAIFSTATVQRPVYTTTPTGPVISGSTNTLGTLRFSYFVNMGVSFNFNLGNHVGVYTGLDMKNLGFIEHIGTIKVKRRTYNLGVPVGIKVGNMEKKGTYLFLGGGVDAPFNYKEKSFVTRSAKTKYSEWFSDKTPAIMPYVFVGMKFHRGVSLKAQYYLGNFLNTDYLAGLVMPYAGYDVHVMMLSLGFTSHYGKHKNSGKSKLPDIKNISKID